MMEESTPTCEGLDEQDEFMNIENSLITLSDLVTKFTLKDYLDITPGGRIIKLTYHNKNDLNSTHRNALVHIVVDRLIDTYLITQGSLPSSFHIKPAEFQDLAKQIIELFPTETAEVYYSPFETITVKEGNRKIKARKLASGKLLDYFRYRKRILQQDGIIVKEDDSSDPVENLENTAEDLETNDNTQESESHTWLLNGNIESEEILLEKWKDTWNIRQKLLKDERIAVAEYFQKYFCLRLQFGITLINSDFDQLHPGKGSSLKNKWPNLRQNLIKLMLVEVKSPFLQNILKEDQQDAIVILLLPKLIRPSAIKRKDPNSVVKKPSMHEAEKAFIIVVPISADVEKAIADQKNEYAKKQVPLQPFLLFVGSENAGFSEFYVCLDDLKFKLSTPIDAVDFLFKLFFAVDIHYPSHCYHLWQFIQITGFEMLSPGEKVGMPLKLLCNKLKGM